MRSFVYDLEEYDVWYVHFQLDPTKEFILLGRANEDSEAQVYVYPINRMQENMEAVPPVAKIPSHISGLLRDISFSPNGQYMIISSDTGYLSLLSKS